MERKYSIAEDARPQIYLLVVATLISVGLWLLSMYLPLVGYISYPLRLFATFVHEGSHVLATLFTGNSVQSLTVAADGSGEVWSNSSGWFSQLLISSAGYIGTTTFGAALLVWIRRGYSARLALWASAGFVGVMTLIFGVLAPLWNLLANVTFGGVVFTVLSGTILTLGLAAAARYTNLKWANFAVAFIAVQCLLNAVFDLISLLFLSVTTNVQSDAANMAAASGIPSIVWAFIWLGISLVLISVGLRVYAVSKKPAASDSVFED